MFQILLVNAIPALKQRFLAYGSRATIAPCHHAASCHTQDKSSRLDSQIKSGRLERLLDEISKIQVPHSYFKHFYIVSLLSSVFWLSQIITRSNILLFLCRQNQANPSSRTMSIDRILLTWALMTLQGLRRLIESTVLAKPSASKMWLAHWLLGIAFYISMGVAVWIEGSGGFL